MNSWEFYDLLVTHPCSHNVIDDCPMNAPSSSLKLQREAHRHTTQTQTSANPYNRDMRRMWVARKTQCQSLLAWMGGQKHVQGVINDPQNSGALQK